MNRINRIRVFHMHETCERDTFFVELTTDEGFTMTPESFATGSLYDNFKGLSLEEARDRALTSAADWGDFLRVPVDPYFADGVEIKPSFLMETYTVQRELADMDDIHIHDRKSFQ